MFGVGKHRWADFHVWLQEGEHHVEPQDPFFQKEKWEQIYIYIHTYMYILYTLWLFDIAMDNGPFMDDKHHDLPFFI